MTRIALFALILLILSCKKEVTTNNEKVTEKIENLEKTTSQDSIINEKVKMIDDKSQSVIKISYAGTIDHLAIEMELNINKTTHKIDGTYKYLNRKSEETIFLNGTLPNNKITLNEKVYADQKEQNTGSFVLNFTQAHSIDGYWQNPSKSKTLSVNLTSKESFKNHPFLFTFDAQIKSYKIKRHSDSEDMADCNEIELLKIYHDNKLLQTLTFHETFVYDKNDIITLEDLNFDGYYDVKITEDFPEAIKNDIGFRYFIYNPQTDLFEENMQLNELTYLTFNSFTKEFNKMYADGSGNESTEYYQWKNNSFKMVRKEEATEEDPNIVTTYY